MRKILSVCLTLMIALSVMACGTDNQEELVPATLKATIIEITNNDFIVGPVEGSQELKSADRIEISREKMTSLQEPQIGDTLEIVYSGGILETYPAQLTEIQSITIIDAALNEIIEEKEEHANMEYPMMIMVNGVLYYATGAVYDKEKVTCGTLDGQITSTTDEIVSVENNQSTFGSGYGYQYGEKNTIHVFINDEWLVFQEYKVGSFDGIDKKLESLSEDEISGAWNDEAYEYDMSQVLIDTEEITKIVVTKGWTGEERTLSDIDSIESNKEFTDVLKCYQELNVAKDTELERRSGYQYCMRLYDANDELLQTVTPYKDCTCIDSDMYDGSKNETSTQLLLTLDALDW